jgi:hypothetical protein
MRFDAEGRPRAAFRTRGDVLRPAALSALK